MPKPRKTQIIKVIHDPTLLEESTDDTDDIEGPEEVPISKEAEVAQETEHAEEPTNEANYFHDILDNVCVSNFYANKNYSWFNGDAFSVEDLVFNDDGVKVPTQFGTDYIYVWDKIYKDTRDSYYGSNDASAPVGGLLAETESMNVAYSLASRKKRRRSKKKGEHTVFTDDTAEDQPVEAYESVDYVGEPVVADFISFKVLEFNLSTFTPELSSKQGQIIAYNEETDMVKLRLSEKAENTEEIESSKAKKPSKVFREMFQDNNNSQDYHELKWQGLADIKKIIPKTI
jgi:hypothetical protein